MKLNRNASNKLLILMMILGLSITLYPALSNSWNSYRQTTAIMNYAKHVDSMDQEERRKIIAGAEEYNRQLYEDGQRPFVLEHRTDDYNSALNWGGSGMMGWIDIPSINCYLPIYHGTDEATLQKAVGHLNWTSLPIGGKNSHCVLSGHRGFPSAKLFTDIVKLKKGDVFKLVVLDETLTYEVDQILTVAPREVNDLRIVEGEDYCTLLTCTPYGINTHRYLVRGHRITPEEKTNPTEEFVNRKKDYIHWIIGGLIAIIIIYSSIRYLRKKSKLRSHL